MKGLWNVETVRFPFAVAAGVLWALAFPLPGWAGLAWVVPALLWYGAMGLTPAGAFRFGYVAGLAQFVVLLRWMRHMPVSVGAPAAWLSLSAYCALFPGIWLWIGRRLQGGIETEKSEEERLEDSVRPVPSGPAGRSWRAWTEAAADSARRPWARRASLLVTAAMAWVALEWIRSRFLSGFPWAPLGVTQWRQLPLIQVASITGVYGVSFLVCWAGLAVGGALMAMAFRPQSRWSWTAEARLPLAAVLMVMGWGFWEIMQYRRLEHAAGETTLRLALVQPSVPQTLLWDAAEDARVFAKIEDLSRQALALQPDVLVWPEGSFGLDGTNYLRMRGLLDGTGVDWVFGTEDAAEKDGRVQRFNAAFLKRRDGTLFPAYHKRRLVIFGEFVPLVRWLPFLRWLTPIGDGFAAGDRPADFPLGTNAVASPVICFEDVFPHGVRDHVNPATDFVLELTNDGWFSESAAQWQHAACAVFRSVENGVPLVRACNNGITGWWDACGTPRAVLGEPDGDVYAPGVLLVSVPVRMPRTETPYHRHGDAFAGICVAVVAWRTVRGRKG